MEFLRIASVVSCLLLFAPVARRVVSRGFGRDASQGEKCLALAILVGWGLEIPAVLLREVLALRIITVPVLIVWGMASFAMLLTGPWGAWVSGDEEAKQTGRTMLSGAAGAWLLGIAVYLMKP